MFRPVIRAVPSRLPAAGFVLATPLTRTLTSASKPRLGGGHGHEHGQHSEDRTHGPEYGIHLHEPARWHKLGGQFFGALLWFWLLYRLKNDWRNLFFWDNPFQGHDAHDDHGHGHDEKDDHH